MVRLPPHYRIGAIDLLHKKQADHLMRKSHPRKRYLRICPLIDRIIKAIRSTDHKNQMRHTGYHLFLQER